MQKQGNRKEHRRIPSMRQNDHKIQSEEFRTVSKKRKDEAKRQTDVKKKKKKRKKCLIQTYVNYNF